MSAPAVPEPPAIDVPEAPRKERRLMGGSWLRPFRRWDGYSDAVEAAIRQAEGAEAGAMTREPAETR